VCVCVCVCVRVQSVSTNSQCVYPCKCPNDPPRCKTSRTIKDGCDCCHICPRQQGDLCDRRDKCDEDRGLHCDFTLDDGHRGICRGQSVSHYCLHQSHFSPRQLHAKNALLFTRLLGILYAILCDLTRV